MSLGSNTNYTSSAIWNEALSVPGPKIGKVKPKKSDLIRYPAFLAGAQLVSDEYWRDLLIKGAKGKFPRGFAFIDGCLLHRVSGIRVQLPEDPPSLVETVVLFLRQKGSIYSPNDLQILESAAHQILIDGEEPEVAWARIFKGKNSRAKYIRDYVDRVYAGLTLKIRDELFTQINTHLELGLLKKEDILFTDGRVELINGLSANTEGVFPTRPMNLKIKISKSTPVEEKKPSEYQHYENWVIYMQKYLKYILDSQSATISATNLSGLET